MTVWIVTQTYDDYAYVNDYLEIGEADVEEILGVFQDEVKARELQRKLQKAAAEAETECDCDPVTIYVREWEVR